MLNSITEPLVPHNILIDLIWHDKRVGTNHCPRFHRTMDNPRVDLASFAGIVEHTSPETTW